MWMFALMANGTHFLNLRRFSQFSEYIKFNFCFSFMKYVWSRWGKCDDIENKRINGHAWVLNVTHHGPVLANLIWTNVNKWQAKMSLANESVRCCTALCSLYKHCTLHTLHNGNRKNPWFRELRLYFSIRIKTNISLIRQTNPNR